MPNGMKEARRAFYLGALRAFFCHHSNDPTNGLLEVSERHPNGLKRHPSEGAIGGKIGIKNCEKRLGGAVGDAVGDAPKTVKK